MSASARDVLRPRRPARGFTLVELVIAIGVAGIVAASVPVVALHGVRSMVFLPRRQLVMQAATEILQAAVEGSISSVSGQRVPGLRAAARQASPAEPAIWLAEDSRIGFLLPYDPLLTPDNQYVVLRLDGDRIARAVYPSNACPPPAATEELIPYHTAGVVRVVASPLFRYYNQTGTLLSPPGCAGGSSIRRVDIAFVAQTGEGEFDAGDARVDLMSSVAIRFP